MTGSPPKSSKYKKINLGWLGVSRMIYVNVDSPNLGFPYFNFLGGHQSQKTPCSSIYVNVDSPNPGFPYFLGEAQCKNTLYVILFSEIL